MCLVHTAGVADYACRIGHVKPPLLALTPVINAGHAQSACLQQKLVIRAVTITGYVNHATAVAYIQAKL